MADEAGADTTITTTTTPATHPRRPAGRGMGQCSFFMFRDTLLSLSRTRRVTTSLCGQQQGFRTMKTNDSLGLTPEEHALVLTGIQAMDEMGKRTFEHWIDGIGPALKMLKTKPGADNHMRWKTIREEAGFGKIDGAVVSRLLTIMQDENIGPVRKWYASLPTNKQFAYCSPASIMRKCPHFNKSSKESTSPKETKYKKLESEHSAALEELHQLKKKLSEMDSVPRREMGANGTLSWKIVDKETESVNVDGGHYQLDQMGFHTYSVMYWPDSDRDDDGVEVAEVSLSKEEITRLCLERARAIAEQDWATRRPKTDSPTPPLATHDAGVDSNESESEPEAESTTASSESEEVPAEDTDTAEPVDAAGESAVTKLKWKRCYSCSQETYYEAIAGSVIYIISRHDNKEDFYVYKLIADWDDHERVDIAMRRQALLGHEPTLAEAKVFAQDFDNTVNIAASSEAPVEDNLDIPKALRRTSAPPRAVPPDIRVLKPESTTPPPASGVGADDDVPELPPHLKWEEDQKGLWYGSNPDGEEFYSVAHMQTSKRWSITYFDKDGEEHPKVGTENTLAKAQHRANLHWLYPANRKGIEQKAAAVKTTESTKTGPSEFADRRYDDDGITWKPREDGGCEGYFTGRFGTFGAWAITPTVDGDGHYAAYHPHGVMSLEGREDIGTFPTIEEAQAACEADRVVK
jgi:hypothetical protein